MKRFKLFLVFLMGINGFSILAQNDTIYVEKPSIKYTKKDSANVKLLPLNNNFVCYTITFFKDSSKEILYKECKKWVDSLAGDANITLVDDSEMGVILLKGFNIIYINNGEIEGGVSKYKMWWMIRLSINTNRVRMNVFDIFIESYTFPRRIEPAEVFNKILSENEQNKKHLLDGRKKINTEINFNLIGSLQDSLFRSF